MFLVDRYLQYHEFVDRIATPRACALRNRKSESRLRFVIERHTASSRAAETESQTAALAN
jgi:hypothetical protein